LVPGVFTAIFATMAILAVLFSVALYIYFAYALVTIAKKLGYDTPWIGWIPLVNLVLFPLLAKKHWAWYSYF